MEGRGCLSHRAIWKTAKENKRIKVMRPEGSFAQRNIPTKEDFRMETG